MLTNVIATPLIKIPNYPGGWSQKPVQLFVVYEASHADVIQEQETRNYFYQAFPRNTFVAVQAVEQQCGTFIFAV